MRILFFMPRLRGWPSLSLDSTAVRSDLGTGATDTGVGMLGLRLIAAVAGRLARRRSWFASRSFGSWCRRRSARRSR